MPKIAEIREIDGECWVRVETRDDSPIQFLTSDEIDKSREREQHQIDEIERLTAALETCRELRQHDATEIKRLRGALNQQTTEGK
jgi:hypothetical protein